jgi:TRAP-type C4-dicarboxylate transport system permease small subunit
MEWDIIMNKNKALTLFKTVIDNIEIYIGTTLFLVLMVLLMTQVTSRFVFGKSYAWIEEVATIMLVAMVYCGTAGAVRDRKFLRIETLLELMPFKMKKVILILGNIIQAGWIAFILVPFFNVMNSIGGGKTSILRINKQYIYAIIPILLILTLIRTAQEIYILIHEDKKELGRGKTSFDLDLFAEEGNKSRNSNTDKDKGGDDK